MPVKGLLSSRRLKYPDATHPYHTNEALDEINKRQATISIKSGAFQAVLNKHKINNQTKSDMRWVIDGRPRYSEKFIRWFVDNLKQPKWSGISKEFRRSQLRNKR